MRTALTAGLAAVALLAGCGGDGDGGGGGPAVTVPATEPLDVTASEYRFDPESVVVDSTSDGSTDLRIELRNEGAIAHDLRVRRGGEELGGTPIFGPNQTKTATVSLSPGDYEFFCSVADHEQLGMKGSLTVR